MKAAFKSFSLVLLATSTAFATTMAVAHNAVACSSSGSTEITVTQTGRAIADARVDIYREIENGERAVWTGRTDVQGLVKTPNLQPAIYRVFIDSGNDYGVVALTVKSGSKTGMCDLKFAPPPKTEAQILADLVGNVPSIQLREFHGVAQDFSGAVIPLLKIRIFPKGTLNKSIAEIESGSDGQFHVILADGDYVAFFYRPGFRERAITFDVGKAGWIGFRVVMVVESSADSGPSPLEWTPSK